MSALVDKVDEILTMENGKFPPELARRWHKALAVISRGPPDLDQGYYFYGLLDCVSQLAAVSDPRMLGEGLLDRIKDLVFDSVVPEFRWKAVSISSFRGEAEQKDQYQFALIQVVDRSFIVLSLHSLGTVSNAEKGCRNATRR